MANGKRGKVVLEEDEYVEALDHIIERDFFPDLEALRTQNEGLTGASSVLRSTEAHTITTGQPLGSVQRQVPYSERSQRSTHSVTRSIRSTSGWDQATPDRGTRSRAISAGMHTKTLAVSDRDGDGESGAGAAEAISLNQFVAIHTSEDNAAFGDLQDKTVQEHQRRYYWAYDAEGGNALDPKLHLLSNGTWITAQQRQIVDKVLAPKGPKDERPTAPDSWPFRARNPLLFPPELEVNKEICQVPPASKTETKQLLLKGQERAIGQESALTSNTRPIDRLGRPPRAPKETVYANSRFPAAVLSHTPGFASETAAINGSATSERDLQLVQMTPLIAPGIDASPLMTWGEIEGTPMVLDPSATPERVLNGPSFTVKESSRREQLADQLEMKARQRTSARQQKPVPGTSLFAGRKRSAAGTKTPTRTESLRSRLSSIRSSSRTPFSSDSELRASYATPIRAGRHHKTPRRR